MREKEAKERDGTHERYRGGKMDEKGSLKMKKWRINESAKTCPHSKKLRRVWELQRGVDQWVSGPESESVSGLLPRPSLWHNPGSQRPYNAHDCATPHVRGLGHYFVLFSRPLFIYFLLAGCI